MPRTLALITVHGMGDTARDYYADLYATLKKAVGKARWEKIAFKAVYYQDILQGSQAEVFNRMRGQIDWMKLRKFLLYGFSDAASLEYRKDAIDSPYYATQTEILRVLDAALAGFVESAVPAVIIAQSLGCHVISSYIWDARQQHASAGIWSRPLDDGVTPGSPRDRFRRMRTLRCLYTTGCNIPIFVAGHEDIQAIPPPSRDFKWYNFFDEDDVLGWPLRPLSPSYEQLVEDIPVNAGGGLAGTILQSWNPFSHGQYWSDSEVTRHLASAIRQLV